MVRFFFFAIYLLSLRIASSEFGWNGKEERIMASDQIIRSHILGEAQRLLAGAVDGVCKEDVTQTLFGDNKRKEKTFEICLKLVDTEVKLRQSVGWFLLWYFPLLPQGRFQKTLYHVAGELCSGDPSDYQSVFLEIKTIIEVVSPSIVGTPLQVASSERIARLRYAQHREHNFVALAGGDQSSFYSRRSEMYAQVRLIADKDVVRVAKSRNKQYKMERVEREWAPGSFSRCEDYIYQFPAHCKEEDVEKCIRVLGQLWDHYEANPNVVRASTFLIKQMCDGYVSKIPFRHLHNSFRIVSFSFLPTLLQWMEAEYLCIRHHVYDFLLTLGVHLQLLDSQDVYPGAMGMGQYELKWLLINVLKRQIFIVPSDETTWEAAAKCILAVLPSHERYLIDCRVFVSLFNITGLAELHPDIYGSLVEAFVQSVLVRPTTKHGDGTDTIYTTPNTINPMEFAKLGDGALGVVLSIYRRAYTVGGRLWMFKLVFACGAEQLRTASSRSETLSVLENALNESFNCFIVYGFFWSWHTQLFFTTPSVRTEVLNKFSMTDGKHSEYAKSIHTKMIQFFMDAAEQDAMLPEAYEAFFTQSNLPGSPPTAEIIEDALQAAQLLLKAEGRNGGTERGSRHYNEAWRLLLRCLQIIRSSGVEEAPLLQRMTYFIVACENVSDNSEINRIRRVLPDLLTSVFIQWKVSMAWAENNRNDALIALLEMYLFIGRVPCFSLMTIYSNLFQTVSDYDGRFLLQDAPGSTDLTLLLMDNAAVTPLSTVEGIGVRVLWALYKGLSSETALSACRARQVLVSVMAKLYRGELYWSLFWKYVIADPYPPVSLIGASVVLDYSCDLEHEFVGMWKSVHASADSCFRVVKGE